MSNITVKYNDIQISPTPTVSRSYDFIDTNVRFGQIEQIELASVITGFSNAHTGAIEYIQGIFNEQFKTLEVFEDGNPIYSWPNVVLQEVSIPNNGFYVKSSVPYNARFISYQIPSGVLDPSNEYSFNQGEDGIVTVTHKISARGVRTANGALDNAINFVKTFVKQNPYNNCPPVFIQNSSGVLMSMSENIDRISCSYSVTENYKYITGAGAVNYIQTDSLTIDEDKAGNYPTLDLNIKIQGSPVDSNITEIKSILSSLNTGTILQNYNILTPNIFRNTYLITENTGEAFVELKINYFSGTNSADFNGFFDYSISLDEDLVSRLQNWRIDGDYMVRGPLSFKQGQITTFKSANEGTDGYISYLTGIIRSSPLYTQYGKAGLTMTQINVLDNTGLATLKIGATFSNYDTASGLVQPKYLVDVEPSIWIYELVPSANIEGHYIIQDLQMKNQSKIRINCNSSTTGTKLKDIEIISGLGLSLSGIYIGKAFIQNQTFTSGITNIDFNSDYIGESVDIGFLTSKVHGSYSTNYIRPANFQFGY